ncbi:MAG: cytochrome c biogenesis protein CcsA [Fimbriimonadaceae bacterium]|nr:cytochrome c biogenesis protein CcsA [Fimbriimonadaceae bacterium]
MNRLVIGLLGALMAVGTAATFMVSDAPKFQAPELARIVFWHLPCALVGSFLWLAGQVCAVGYLHTKEARWDQRSISAMEVGTLFGVLAMVTGILFSKVQWGAWWNWDPRQSSYLMVLLIVSAYFALRASVDEPGRRASLSGVYAVASLVPVLFLTFIYPKLKVVQTLHPNVIQGGELTFDPQYRVVFYAMLLLILGLGISLVNLRFRTLRLESALDIQDAELANRDHSAAPRVVRPLSLSPTDQSAASAIGEAFGATDHPR